MVTHYECQKCEDKLSASKPRNKLFHLIGCSELNDKKRFAFYIKRDDKQKPPLVARPFKGLTPAMARRLVRDKETEIQKIAEGISNKSNDYSHDHAVAGYILAVAEQKGSTKISQCSKPQQYFATSLLVRLIIDENLPFSICDNMQHGRPRLLKLLLSYLRPGFKIPLGHKIRGELLDKHYADTVSQVKTVWYIDPDSTATTDTHGSTSDTYGRWNIASRRGSWQLRTTRLRHPTMADTMTMTPNVTTRDIPN